MRSHFNTNEFPELWTKVKALVNTPDEITFNKIWKEILSNPSYPQTFVDYMALELMPAKTKIMWSKVYRKDLSIFEEGDTNMLIEAYVTLLSNLGISLIYSVFTMCSKRTGWMGSGTDGSITYYLHS